jgi:hypothetical protein
MEGGKAHSFAPSCLFAFLPLCLLFLAVSSASAAADFSTPQAAARSLHQAIESADEPAIEQALYAQTDEQKALAHALARLMAAGRRFQIAARKQFGPSAEPLVADMTAADELARVDRATVKQDGDRADLLLPDADRPIPFIRDKNQWRLDIISYAGAQPGRIRKQAPLLTRIAAILDQTTQKIAAGQYDSPQSVRQAMQKQLNDAMTS